VHRKKKRGKEILGEGQLLHLRRKASLVKTRNVGLLPRKEGVHEHPTRRRTGGHHSEGGTGTKRRAALRGEALGECFTLMKVLAGT